MNESNLTKSVLLKIGRIFGLRLFRNNTGSAWTGRIHHKTANYITLVDYRPISFGLIKGSSDYIGWKTVEVTPEMVGQKIAVFTALEFKKPSGRISPDQLNFIEQVRSAGGKAGIVKSEEDAIGIINK